MLLNVDPAFMVASPPFDTDDGPTVMDKDPPPVANEIVPPTPSPTCKGVPVYRDNEPVEVPPFGVFMITSPDILPWLGPEVNSSEPPSPTMPSPPVMLTDPPDTFPEPPDNDMPPPDPPEDAPDARLTEPPFDPRDIPALICKAPPSPSLPEDPTDRVMDPLEPDEEEPVPILIGPLLPSSLIPEATDIEPLVLPVPLSMTKYPDSELALEPDWTTTEPPKLSLSPLTPPADSLSDPPKFALEPLSMVTEPPDTSPVPDEIIASPPVPLFDDPDESQAFPPLPETEEPPFNVIGPASPESDEPAYIWA